MVSTTDDDDASRATDRRFTTKVLSTKQTVLGYLLAKVIGTVVAQCSGALYSLLSQISFLYSSCNVTPPSWIYKKLSPAFLISAITQLRLWIRFSSSLYSTKRFGGSKML
jgi:hypothetical protein